MPDTTPISDLSHDSSEKGKDKQTRRLLIALCAIWVLTLAALFGVTWKAYFDQKDRAKTLAEQIAFACKSGDFGPGVSAEYERSLCSNASKVIKDDPELQEGEIQEPEIQEPEIQEPEIQNPEIQDREKQNPESPDAELQEAEIQDPEIQDPEVQDEEVQDPEVNDPDPASPFNFKFTVPGNGNQPGTTYICNSGTGECTPQ